jgi:hypothetical protein
MLLIVALCLLTGAALRICISRLRLCENDLACVFLRSPTVPSLDIADFCSARYPPSSYAIHLEVGNDMIRLAETFRLISSHAGAEASSPEQLHLLYCPQSASE